LLERKKRLRKVVPKRSGSGLFLDHIEEHGIALFDLVQAADLEGIVAKPKASAYQEKRPPAWVKIKNASYSQKEGRHEMFEGFRKKL